MVMTRLRRFSKPRGAGDQTSGGRGKLLRPATDLSRIEIAVRETLQNSWDARLGDSPLYRVEVYRVPEDARAVLSEYIFTDLPDSLTDLSDSLTANDLHAIEFIDRGTTGLDGPFRASEVAGDGERNNFNSFVFDIGTTKSSARAGGTFGFGKTAAFEISDAHSVVYWTRCRRDDGALEHRLIANTLHAPYEANGARFTGAHWWGDPEDPDIVPLRGEQAERLGRALFRTPFTADETGTSVLVVDPIIFATSETAVSEAETTPLHRVPVRSDAQAAQLVSQIAQGLAASGWPKMIPDPDGKTPMHIQLLHEDKDRQLPRSVRAQYAAYADALTQVRRQQNPFTSASDSSRPQNLVREKTFAIRLRPHAVTAADRREFFGDRTDQIAGHLHVSVSLRAAGGTPVSVPANALCLMRSEAELVVRYDRLTEVAEDLVRWHAVFKPTPECDHHFAASEPPTHDGWNPSSAESEISAYVVERTLQQIRRKTIEYLSEYKPPAHDGQHSVRTVATDLRSFVPLGTVHIEEPESPRRRARAASRPSDGPLDLVEIIDTGAIANGFGQRLTVRVLPTARAVRVTAVAHAITSEGRLALNPDELEIIWTQRGATTATRESLLGSGEVAVLELRTQTRSALEVELQAEVIS